VTRRKIITKQLDPHAPIHAGSWCGAVHAGKWRGQDTLAGDVASSTLASDVSGGTCRKGTDTWWASIRPHGMPALHHMSLFCPPMCPHLILTHNVL
jgi:hypothetical protein